MKKRILLYCTCLMLMVMAFGISGCGISDDSADTVEVPSIAFAPVQEENQKIDIDVYWDATYSMKGYTTIDQDNVYRSLPDDLDDIGNSLGEVKFFGFGKDIMPLEGREHRKFASADAYDQTITAIHNVIQNADTNHLSIIVTDLFESDSDWSNVTKQLKEKYFSQHLSVAIIGVKNPFNGEIFDVGLNAAKFNYNSGNDATKYRPFYMFIMGQDSDVKKFIKSWKEKYNKSNEIHYLVMSENLMDESADLSNMTVTDSENIYADSRLNLPGNSLKEYGIDSPDEKSAITTRFVYSPTEDGCQLDMSKLKTKAEVWYIKDGQWQKSEKNSDINCTFKADENQENNYLVSLDFTAGKTLEPSSVNLIHVAVQPDSSGLILPDWINSWNMDNSVVNASPDQFDGSKTINFAHIISSLKDSVLSTANPSLVNMNLVIQNQ